MWTTLVMTVVGFIAGAGAVYLYQARQQRLAAIDKADLQPPFVQPPQQHYTANGFPGRE
jgi:hypothetical protein